MKTATRIKRREAAIAKLKAAGVTVPRRQKQYPFTDDELYALEAQVAALEAKKEASK